MAEYGLIVALVAIVAIAAWVALGTQISSFINAVAGDI
jgi:Flp pilus assembly pilin Flp